jgi:putative endonuclease
MKGWTYLLECSDGTYYVGSTKDLERRVVEHQSGHGSDYTSRRLPVKLVYQIEFPRIDEAFYFEHQIKNGVEKRKKL